MTATYKTTRVGTKYSVILYFLLLNLSVDVPLDLNLFFVLLSFKKNTPTDHLGMRSVPVHKEAVKVKMRRGNQHDA